VDQDTGQETSEFQELYRSIVSSLSHLFRLSIIIRQSKPRGREGTSSSLPALDPSHDIMHVRDKHGKARQSAWLIERLGKSITQRREYFRYRQWRRDLQDALPKDPDPVSGRHPEDSLSELTDKLPTLKATTFEGSDVMVVDEDISRLEHQEEVLTLASLTSYATSTGGAGGEALRVPNPPARLPGGMKFEYSQPFECPYCRVITEVKSRAHWK
jgi:hypothetical protein